MTPATMSIQVMLLVLLSAFLHASWNAVVKSSSDKFLDIVLVTGGSALLSALVLPFLPVPDPASWPYAAASVVIHVGYFALVGAAYRVGDMSFAYPLMRGTAPVLVTFASGPLIGEYLGVGAWSGVLLISAGVLGMTLAKSRPGCGGQGKRGIACAGKRWDHRRLHDRRWSGRTPVRQRRRLYHVGFPGYGACLSAPGPCCCGGPTWSRTAAPAGISG